MRVEQQVFPRAAACVFTTDGAARLYRDRYPALADRMHVIENGYDEESFVPPSARWRAVNRCTRCADAAA